VIEVSGYAYFPREAVTDAHLEKAVKSPHDCACPHDVQFYHVNLNARRRARQAWIYEEPKGDLTATANRVGFWKDVEIG
jgi:uncharacterized protein (DUF427 family)